GATEVLIASAKRWAIMSELSGAPEPPLRDLLARLSPVDLVLVEGYKREAIPKLEIHRADVGKPLLHPDDDWIVAVASDAPLPQATVPVIDLNDIDKVADVLLAEALPLGRLRAPEGTP
ncbi:MAG: molybdopterin-guanine dinucleotide biosynthesis protein B, partial [Pseudorhodoplanes sp.]